MTSLYLFNSLYSSLVGFIILQHLEDTKALYKFNDRLSRFVPSIVTKCNCCHNILFFCNANVALSFEIANSKKIRKLSAPIVICIIFVRFSN